MQLFSFRTLSGFFRTGETSSSEEYSSSESDHNDQEQQQNTRNVRNLLSSSSDEEGPRTVKSAQAKMNDDLHLIINDTVGALRVDDFSSALDQFKALPLAIAKNSTVIKTSGFPKFVLKGVLDIRAAIVKSNIKLLDADGKRALKELIQKVQKFIQSFQKLFDNYQQQAEAAENDDDEDDDEDEEEDEEEEEEELSDSEEELTDDEDELGDDLDLTKLTGKITRDFWVKKTPTADANKTQEKDARQLRVERQQRKQQQNEEAKKAQASISAQKQASSADQAEKEVSPEEIAKQLREIVATRGKRSTDTSAVLNQLRYLLTKSDSPVTSLRIQCLITMFTFDANSKPTHALSVANWREGLVNVRNVLDTLATNVEVVRLVEEDSFDDTIYDNIDFDAKVDNALQEGTEGYSAEQKAWLAKRKAALADAKRKALDESRRDQGTEGKTYVDGNLYAFLFKVSADYFTGLQNCNYSTQQHEYIKRLKQQPELVEVLREAHEYYISINKKRMAYRVGELILEHLYFRYEEANDVLYHPEAITNVSEVDKWAEFILESDEPRSRIKALLYQLYSWALHNKYDAARERLSMSYLTDTINDLDINTRVLYNRTTTQIGLAAFRVGDYKGSLNCLNDLFNRALRTKELIAQGFAHRNSNDNSSAQNQQKEDREIQEARSRIYPYHLHINLDFLDAAHLISAMLVELPTIAEHAFNTRRVASKTFRRQFQHFIETHSGAAIAMSADTTRDHILLSAFHISRGEWQEAWTQIQNIKILWNNEALATIFTNRLLPTIKTIALKCYLFNLGAAYAGISLSVLSEQFGLSDRDVQTVVNNLAYNESLHVAWNAQSTDLSNPVLQTSYQTSAVAHRSVNLYLERLSSIANPIQRR